MSDPITTLLNLPCVMLKDTDNFSTMPIIESAEHFGSCEFLQFVLTGETIEGFLKRVYKGAETYPMDCSIYAQLAAIVLSDKWPIQGGYIFLYFVKNVPNFWNTKYSELGYILPKNLEVMLDIRDSPTNSKGQWIVRLNNSKFLGLSDDGPRTMDSGEWVLSLIQGLNEFVHRWTDSKMPPKTMYEVFCKVSAEKIMEWFDKGMMDEWDFYSRYGYHDFTVTLDGGKYTVEKNEKEPPAKSLNDLYPSLMVDAWRHPRPDEGVSGTSMMVNIDGEDVLFYCAMK